MPDRRKKSPWPAILLAGRPQAPALAEWILRMSEYAEGLSLVPRIAAIGQVEEPTVRAGGPIGLEARAEFAERLEASLVRRAAEGANPEVDIAGHIRSATNPTAFATFAGGYSPRLLHLCNAMDLVCDAVATCQWSWLRAAQGVAEIGRLSARRVVPTPPEAPEDRVALDATLLVLAELDVEVLTDHQDRNYPVRSVFLRVAPDLRRGKVERWPYSKLLDRLYAMSCVRNERPLKDRRPTIPQLDALLGTASTNGTKSKVAHWRTGRTLRRSDFDDVVTRCLGDGVEHFLANKLYAGATFWHTLIKEAPEHVEWALDRYAFWWSLMRPDGLVDGPKRVCTLSWLA